MSELFMEAETWVGVGLVLFFLVLIYLKVPGAAAKALDGRAESGGVDPLVERAIPEISKRLQ